MTYAEALQELDALYATLPTITCQRRCQVVCGLIILTKMEWLQITRRLGYRPHGKADCVCPMLKQGRCSVHAIRPTICRLWGVTDIMPCPWGCQPDRWLTEVESDLLLAQVEALSAQLFPDSPATAYSHGLTPADIPQYVAVARAQGHIKEPRP